MKERMVKILTLFMAASMTVTPSMSVLAQTAEDEIAIASVEEADGDEAEDASVDEQTDTATDVPSTEGASAEDDADGTNGDGADQTPDSEDASVDETGDAADLASTPAVMSVDNEISLLSDDATGTGPCHILSASGATSGMWPVSASSVTESGDNLIVSVSVSRTTYDKMKIGTAETVVQGTALSDNFGYVFNFTVSKEEAKDQIPFIGGKPDGNWASTTMYLTIDGYLNSGDSEETPDEDQTDDETATGSCQILSASGATSGMWPVSASSVTESGDNLIVSVTVSRTTYDKMKIGTAETVVQGTALSDNSGYVFNFTVSKEEAADKIPFVGGKPDGNWAGTTMYLVIDMPSDDTTETPDEDQKDDETGKQETTETSLECQVLKGAGDTFAMFLISDSKVVKSGDKLIVTMSTSNTGFDKIYLGENADASNDKAILGIQADGVYTFVFEVDASAAESQIPIALGKPAGTWYTSQQLYLSIAESENATPDPEPDPEPDDPTPTPDTTTIPDDGEYSVEVESSATMFKVVDCVLTSKDGKLTAVITLSGTGYDYLYLGSAANAACADQSQWIKYMPDADGKYTYTIPVESLDTPIAVAAHSSRMNTWYDRTLTFKSESLQLLGGDTTVTPDNGTTNDTTNNTDTNPDSESKYESDTSGATSKVNSATTLADGVYTPDKFSWSGGSGRASISCNKVTVKNGQAYATLVFSSENWSYVKANGNTYYGSKGGGTTTFVIPVELNKNNRIIGMTTAMSAAHEVEYSIFVYIAAAGDSAVSELNKNELSEEAPEIVGLELESETELKYAELFKIFNYQDGITLLEVDTSKYTANEDDETEEADETATTEEVVVDEEVAEGSSDKASELYQNKVVRYLIVPEDVEIPVGLDEEMIIVQLPIENAYVASETALNGMKDLDLLDMISAVGIDEEDLEVQEIIDALKAETEEDKVLFAGKCFEPDYKTLVEAKTDLAILPGLILPLDVDASGEELTEEEQEARLSDITERMATLGVPVIFDRSADEKEDLAQAEWIKFYGALFGQQEDAQKLFDAVDKDAE